MITFEISKRDLTSAFLLDDRRLTAMGENTREAGFEVGSWK